MPMPLTWGPSTSSRVPRTMSPSKIARSSTLAYCSSLSLKVAPDTTAVPAAGPELYSHELFATLVSRSLDIGSSWCGRARQRRIAVAPVGQIA